MKIIQIICLLIVLLFSCENASKSKSTADEDINLIIADKFINAFYSFNRDSLEFVLTYADESRLGILYYQKWAECGNYKIIERHDCFKKNDSLVICPITVKDDLITALNINFNVTDTFHLIIQNGQIRSISTSSNDPDLYHEAKKWVKENRNELIEIPCKGIWNDGETPCECVKVMVKGFKEFISNNNSN